MGQWAGTTYLKGLGERSRADLSDLYVPLRLDQLRRLHHAPRRWARLPEAGIL